MYASAQYTKNNASIVAVREDGVLASIPIDPANRDYRLITEGDQELGIVPAPIADYAPPAPTAAAVRAETQRRMILLLGARDAAHLDILISNGSREAIRLLRLGEDRWTPEEAARAAALEQIDSAIEAIRVASNAMEDDPPQNYADDSHWPIAG